MAAVRREWVGRYAYGLADVPARSVEQIRARVLCSKKAQLKRRLRVQSDSVGILVENHVVFNGLACNLFYI
jgi:hypothetical protein